MHRWWRCPQAIGYSRVAGPSPSLRTIAGWTLRLPEAPTEAEQLRLQGRLGPSRAGPDLLCWDGRIGEPSTAAVWSPAAPPPFPELGHVDELAVVVAGSDERVDRRGGGEAAHPVLDGPRTARPGRTSAAIPRGLQPISAQMLAPTAWSGGRRAAGRADRPELLGWQRRASRGCGQAARSSACPNREVDASTVRAPGVRGWGHGTLRPPLRRRRAGDAPGAGQLSPGCRAHASTPSLNVFSKGPTMAVEGPHAS